MFGPHLTIDMYGCDVSILRSREHVYKMLDELPDLLGMRKITQPQILEYPGRVGSFDKGGVSAFVIIAESHISIHTFIRQKYASVDIFSCKEFNVQRAMEYLSNMFKPKKVERNLIMRGREFPKDVEKSKVIVKRDRAKEMHKI